MPEGFIPHGGEFLVNTYTSSSQDDPYITGLADGGYVVTWQSFGQDGSGFGIYAQRYDATGAAVGGEVHVSTTTANYQSLPSISGLADGGYIVVWQSDLQDGSDEGIYGQRYHANGTVNGGEFQINTEIDDVQSRPSVAGLAGGGFVVSWQSLYQDGSVEGIYAQIYNSGGATVGSEFLVNTETSGRQDNTKVAALDGGGFIITWISSNQDGDSGGVFGQMYTSTGITVGSEFQINTYTTSNQADVAVTGLADGGFLVTWESLGQDGSNNGIYGQRYDNTGTAVGGEFSINTYTDDYQSNPSVAALADGGWVVTWKSDEQDGSLYGIYGQRYDAAGDAVGDEFHVSTTTSSSQDHTTVAALENGGFVVTWESPSDGSGDGVYAQQFAAQLFGTSGADVMDDTVGAGWIDGQSGADTLKGLGGKDTIYGGGGGDTLSGGGSKDFLYGEGGKDILKGGKGNDELDGGAKNDRLTGGDGKDKFVFMDGSGMDKITDFEDDIDTYRLDEDLWGGGLTKQQVINTYASVDGADILFDFGADQLRLKGFTDLTELKDDMAFI